MCAPCPAIFTAYLRTMPMAPEVDADPRHLAAWVERTAGRSGADIEAACREAAMAALREAIAAGTPPAELVVTPAHVEQGLAVVLQRAGAPPPPPSPAGLAHPLAGSHGFHVHVPVQ